MNLFHKHYGLLLVLAIGAILRLWQLGSVPQGITHDEMGYIFNAYSISQTGKNVFSEFLPFLTWMVQGAVPFMPGTIYTMVPVFWILPLSPFAARFPSAIFGIADVALLYILVSQLFRKKSLAVLSSFFLAISPWHLHFSRSAYDANFSLFFYLLGIALYFYEIKSKRFPIFSGVAFLIGTYSYRGMSIIAFPLFFTLLLYSFYALKATKKQILFFIGIISMVFISMLVVTLLYGAAYVGEGQALFSNPKIQTEIDTKSREAQGPLSLKRIFLNKPMHILSDFRENYVKSYSPEYLFLYTEPSQIYSIWSRGRIYFIDLIFIILGAIFLFKQRKKEALFVFSLLFIGGLPGGIGGLPYSSRNFFLSLIFPILTAGGVLFVLNLKTLRKYKVVFSLLIVIIYSYAFSSYLFDYYFRYSTQAAESWAKSIKDVSLLANSNVQKYNRITIAPSSFGDVVQYAFYTRLPASNVQEIWKNKVWTNSLELFKYKNVIFASGCRDIIREENTLIIVRGDCLKESTPSAYIRDFYLNPVWKIYER